MFNKLKKRIIQKIWNYPPKNILTNKINVAIQCNNYFTKHKWLNQIEQSLSLYQNFNFIFFKKKFHFIRVLNHCEAGFFFDLSSIYLSKETKLKMIYLGVSGHKFDFGQFSKIKLYSSKGISSNSIADYVLSTTILIVNSYNQCIENKVLRKWDQRQILSKNFKKIEDYKIGILGVGNNGKKISEKFSKLGCLVFGCDKLISDEFKFINQWFPVYEIGKFCSSIDILIITVSATEETKNLINYDFIKRYLQGKYIINISRGNIIVQKDLKRCLKEKIIVGAVLDVFEKEPLPFYDSLWNFKNLIITPHISGNINRFVTTIQDDFLMKLSSEFNS